MRCGWTLFGLAGWLGCLCGAAMGQRPAYQPAGRPAGAGSGVTATSAMGATEIHVDQRCRILPGAAAGVSGKRAKPWSDWNTCHLEQVFDTKHRVQTVVGTELRRSWVEIFEQQYVLGNQSQQPDVFIIEQPALKGWTIEGDPPPFRVAGGKEYYRAWVQPGETVRLHVGMRRETAEKPKMLGARVAAGEPGPPLPEGFPAGTAETPNPLPAGFPQM